VEVTGSRLVVNADASGGELRAAVTGDERLQVERAVPLRGDQVSAVCRWRGADLKRLRGKRVQLVFALRSARIFSFGFEG
jgi:hypothetical protein